VGVERKQLSSRAADNPGMRTLIFVALVGFAACTKHNPNACCTTAEQCSALGLDGVTACKSDLICDQNGACVMPQCSTSADCTSPGSPICIGQQCVAKCTSDPDCTGLAGTPHCGSDGVCVACVDGTQCTADAPVCDADVHACRGCTADAECAPGVCLDSSGMCAADADVIYVRADGSDTGECTASAPCLTLPYAFGKVGGTRTVVHILGTTLSVGSNAVDLPLRLVYIDGEDTTIRRSGQGPVFTAAGQFVSAVLEKVNVGVMTSGDQSLSISAGSVAFFGDTIDAPFVMTGGNLEISHSTLLPAPSVAQTSQCSTAGTMSIHDSTIHGDLKTTDCTLTLARNHIDSLSTGLVLGGNAVVVVENNTITSSDYFTDAMSAGGTTGSTVRFNTFANTSGVDMQAQVLTCSSSTVSVTSNIFAWHSSMAPGNCSITHSLFDAVAGLQPGAGNHVGDAATFFVDLPNTDLHLVANSPAKGIGEMGLPVTTDIDGNPRPQPNGSAPDVGAYEAP
jgi:hypothetical protein